MPQVSLPDFIAKARSGDHLVSFPTDTVPALAVRPDRAALVYEAKQRQLDKPLILMAADAADLWLYVAGTPAERQLWQQVVDRHWPGALTLVLPASDRVPAAMNPKDPTSIGVRVPNQAIAQAILAQTGPLATTSANRSGQPALQTQAEVEAAFPQVITLQPAVFEMLGTPLSEPLSEAFSRTGGIPSTVVRWTGTGWEVLRQGAITLDAYE